MKKKYKKLKNCGECLKIVGEIVSELSFYKNYYKKNKKCKFKKSKMFRGKGIKEKLFKIQKGTNNLVRKIVNKYEKK